MGARPVSVVRVGRETRPPLARATVEPDEVSTVDDGIRYFADGALVGLWRSLRAHRVVDVDEDVVTVEPEWSGEFVPVGESAAAWAEKESARGRWVLAPVLLAYDTSERRYLWSCAEPSAADGTVFAVLLPPRAVAHVRELANQSESGG